MRLIPGPNQRKMLTPGRGPEPLNLRGGLGETADQSRLLPKHHVPQAAHYLALPAAQRIAGDVLKQNFSVLDPPHPSLEGAHSLEPRPINPFQNGGGAFGHVTEFFEPDTPRSEEQTSELQSL